jgi:hypothetical protein
MWRGTGGDAAGQRHVVVDVELENVVEGIRDLRDCAIKFYSKVEVSKLERGLEARWRTILNPVFQFKGLPSFVAFREGDIFQLVIFVHDMFAAVPIITTSVPSLSHTRSLVFTSPLRLPFTSV